MLKRFGSVKPKARRNLQPPSEPRPGGPLARARPSR